MTQNGGVRYCWRRIQPSWQFSLRAVLGLMAQASVVFFAIAARPTWGAGVVLLALSVLLPAALIVCVANSSMHWRAFYTGSLVSVSMMLPISAMATAHVIDGEALSWQLRRYENASVGGSTIEVQPPDGFAVYQTLACHLQLPATIFWSLAAPSGVICVLVGRGTREQRHPASAPAGRQG